jgi:hypothetical protein
MSFYAQGVATQRRLFAALYVPAAEIERLRCTLLKLFNRDVREATKHFLFQLCRNYASFRELR